MSVRICRSAVMLLLVSLLIAACAPSATRPASEKGAAPAEKGTPGDAKETPKQGGTIVRVSTATIAPADPAMSQTPYTVWYYVGDPMLYRDIDTYQLLPGLIESWEVSKGGKEITLHVRKGVKFHNKPPINGRELEARDIIYTLKSNTGQQYPELPSLRFPRKASFAAMVDAVAVDKYTVKVTLNQPSVSFMDAMADYRSTWVTPDGLREGLGGVDSLSEPSVTRQIGTGPWIMTKFGQLQEVIYQRNPEYWDKPKPYADTVKFVFLPDPSTSLAAFVAGQIPLVSVVKPEDRAFVQKAKKDAVIRPFVPSSCWYRLSFNMERKPFDDVRVRKALFLIVDSKKIGEHLLGDWEGKPMWRWPGPIPYVFQEALPQEELAKHPMYQGPTPENVAEARRLLKEAGYENGFSFEMIGSSTTIKEEATLIEADISKYLPGVKVKLAGMDSAVHRARAANGDYDVQDYCHIFDVTAVSHLAASYHSQGGRNYPRYKNAKMDELLDKAEQELDLEKRKALLREAQLIALEDVPWRPTYQGLSMLAFQPWLKGVKLGPGTNYDMLVKDWWIGK